MPSQDAATSPAPQDWLIAYAIGPVSQFVSAARRMGDYWAGSQLLAHLSRRFARFAIENGAEQVFPSLADMGQRSTWPNRGILLSRVAQPHTLAAQLEERLRKTLRQLAGARLAAFMRDLPESKRLVNSDWYFSQIDGLLELHVVWTPCSNRDDPELWRRDYRHLHQLLLARKRTRAFDAAHSGEAPGHPKSALDAARPSVLLRDYLSGEEFADHRRRHAVDDDALDGPGLLKRLLGRRESFPAITRIALDPWIDRLRRDYPEKLKLLDEKYASLRRCCPELAGRSRPHAGVFEWDSQLLMLGRLDRAYGRALRDDANPGSAAMAGLAAALEDARAALGRLPSPYVALIATDLDHFGKALWDADRTGQILLGRLASEFARLCLDLALSAGGTMLYAAGDESLAVVPATRALDVAHEFRAGLESTQRKVGYLPQSKLAPAITVSVGVAFVHALTPLRVMRANAQRALGLAKRGEFAWQSSRNALAVIAHPRAGAPVAARFSWASAGSDSGSQRLALWQKAFSAGALPHSTPHLFSESSRYATADPRLLEAALGRFAARREPQPADAAPVAWIDAAKSAMNEAGGGPAEMRDALVREWLLARWLSKECR